MTDQASSTVYMRKALRCLASARTMLSGGDTEGTCNRAYYAMFYAAHTALLAVENSDHKTIYKKHSGLIAAFGQRIVGGEQMNPELGRQINRVEQLRLRSDYIGDPPPLEDATSALEQAESFVAAIAERFGVAAP